MTKTYNSKISYCSVQHREESPVTALVLRPKIMSKTHLVQIMTLSDVYIKRKHFTALLLIMLCELRYVVEISAWVLAIDFQMINDKAKGKKTCLTGERIPKSGVFFKHFLPNLPEKIVIFSCSLRSKFFMQICVLQMADFTIFGS